MKRFTFKNPILYSTFFTVVSLFVRRYAFGIGDQAIHLPLIFKLVDSSLYPADLLFTAGQSDLSLFYKIISFIISNSNFNIETVFFAGYLINLLFFYFALFCLGKVLLKKKYWSTFLLGAAFLIPIQIGGAATYSIEISYVPRFVAFMLSLWTIYCLFTKKYIWFGLLLSLVFLIHPISFLYLFLILIFIIIYGKHNIPPANLILAALFFIFINFPIFSNYLRNFQLNSFSQSNSVWIEVLRKRNEYAFLDLWDYKAWINLALLLLPSIYYVFLYNKSVVRLRQIIKAIVIACIFASITQYIFTTLYPVPLIIQLQLGRIWGYAYLSSTLAIIAIVLNKEIRLRKISYFFVISLLIASFFYHTKWYYTQNVSWVKVQKWINNNLGEKCIFLTPFKHQGFRVYAKRSTVGEYKDGSLSFYSQQFALAWDEREREISDWERLSVDQLNNLQSKYNFSYLVTLSKRTITLEPVYNDGVYAVYRMPDIKDDCEMKSLAKDF